MGSSLSHTWSLAQEEQFYLIWPLLLSLLLARRVRLGALLLMCAVLSSMSAIWIVIAHEVYGPTLRVAFGSDMRSFGLLLGCTLAIAFAMPAWRSRLSRLCGKAVIPTLSVLFILVAWLHTNLYGRFTITLGFTFVDIAAATIIAHLLLGSTVLRDVFALKPVVWIGQRSYGLYLYHFPVITFALATRRFHHLGNGASRMVFMLVTPVHSQRSRTDSSNSLSAAREDVL